MAEDEIHELLVKVRPDTGDTEDELEGVSEQFDETADETERTAGVLGDMSGRMKGFAAVIVGTLVTLAAGLATQVPVIQESASALGSIVDAIALRVDEKLRPSLSLLNADIFELSDAIARNEGEFTAFMDVLGDVLILLGTRMPSALGDMMVQLGIVAVNWGTIWDEMKQTVDDIVDDITGFVDDMVAGIIGHVNRAIRALNMLPNTNIQTIETPTPRRNVFSKGGAAMDDPASTGGGGQVDRLINALENATVQTEVNLDSRKVGEATKPLTVRGALGRGRGARMR